MLTMRSGRKVYTIPGPDFGVRIIEPGAVAAAADWWLGPWPNYPLVPPINPACAVGAYRAVNTPGTPWPGGPNVYADTLVNLADALNPLTEGNGVVPWNVLTGWGFVAALLQWLDTGLVPAQGGSVLVQFANDTTVGNRCFFGQIAVTGDRFLVYNNFAIQVVYGAGGHSFVPPVHLTGNLGIAGQQSYRDGVVDGGPIGGTPWVTVLTSYIGCRNRGGVGAEFFVTADIESLWFGDCIPTPGQMLALADPVLGAMPNL